MRNKHAHLDAAPRHGGGIFSCTAGDRSPLYAVVLKGTKTNVSNVNSLLACPVPNLVLPAQPLWRRTILLS
ncbi:hypothetical protein JW998_13170 [candidate division KSB1 bacterium]|nr:hypothetical protein [candidate division KSB1 bacterium]